jgi:glucose-6-phosphate 1-dehydrogenase
MVQEILYSNYYAWIAMEPPVSFDANEIRNKKVDVLHALHKIDPKEVHLYAGAWQYSGGWVKGKQVQGYRQEKKCKYAIFVGNFCSCKIFY